MTVSIPEEFDSKFRFILVAAERAKQIQHGAPPRIKSQSRKPASIAVREVEENLVPYIILSAEETKEE
jgi:DNA-directed RNA polymerase subunit omega